MILGCLVAAARPWDALCSAPRPVDRDVDALPSGSWWAAQRRELLAAEEKVQAADRRRDKELQRLHLRRRNGPKVRMHGDSRCRPLIALKGLRARR